MILTDNKNRYESPLAEAILLRMEAILNNLSDTTPIQHNSGEDEEIPG